MPTRTPTDPDIQALTGLHLYHAKLSNSSMRVRLLLEEKGLAWTSHLLDASRQDNLSESYLRINPTSLIPSLARPGGEQPATTLKPWMYAVTGTRTKRPEDMERYRQLQSDSDLVAFHQRSLDGFSDEEVADAVQRNHAILERMEATLQDAPWLVGSRYSLADIAWFPNVLVLHLLGFPMERYPAVRRWLDAIQRRPACGARVRQGVFRLPGWAVRLAVSLRKNLRG